MRCNCCDRKLSDEEISYNPEIDAFELCHTCLEIALDAAFSDGYTDPDEDDVTSVLDAEDTVEVEVPYSDLSIYRSLINSEE